MGEEVRILTVGESSLVEGILISLEHDPLIALQQVRVQRYDTLASLIDFEPALIIYQRSCPGIEAILRQLCRLSSVRLIGLDLCCDRVLVMDSWSLDAPSMADIREIVLATTGGMSTLTVPGHSASRARRTAPEAGVLSLDD